ncbi:MAG: hypothetical protein U1F41_14215 [Burkholderiales bacterium]
MSAWVVGFITLAAVYSGALLGLRLQRLLPKHHLDGDSKDAVKLVAGLLATLSALVLGLLIASGKSSFDAMSDALRQSGAKVVVIDRLLAQYGPEAKGVREQLKLSYADRIAKLFPDARSDSVKLAPDTAPVEGFERSLRALAPVNEDQRAIVARIHQLSDEVTQTRWLAFEEASNSTPPAFLVVLVSWLVMMFVCFGLFTPPNPTAFGALFLGALAVSTSIFLIEEMNHPLGGVIAIRSEPMRSALSVLGQ